MLHGDAVYIYAFDLAYDMRREPVPQLLGCPVEEYALAPSKRSPKRLFFYRPLTATLPPETRRVAGRTVEVHRSVKLFRVGAVSLQIRVPFEAETLAELVAWHDLAFESGTLETEVDGLASRIRDDVAPWCVRPVERVDPGEPYTVFVFESLPGEDAEPPARAEAWLEAHRQEVAGLLACEPEAARLSPREIAETTGRVLSYYEDDLVVVDWDAAIVAGEREDLGDVLHVMELANVQRTELTVYDRMLDASLEGSYRDLGRRTPAFRRGVRRNLRELRVDLARLSDEITNISKFFGDWHLARLYQIVHARFHLSDWHRAIDDKLSTLGDLYELLQQDRMNFWMVVLEATIVLLFILDVILLVLGL